MSSSIDTLKRQPHLLLMLLLLAVQLASLRVGCRGIEVASRNASPSISDATSHSTQSLADVAPLVQSADAAFARGEDGKGIAYLSAALVHSPGDDKALNTYRGLLRRRFEDALTARDWSRAAVAVAAYDQIIRDGLRSASTVVAVDSLVVRQKEATAWQDELASSENTFVQQVIAESNAELAKPDVDLSGLSQKVTALPVERIPQDTADDLASLVLAIAARQSETTLDTLKKEATALSKDAEQPDLSSADLQTLRTKADRLLVRAVEASDNADESAAGPLSVVKTTIAQLDQRLQVDAVRRVQTIADADAIQIVKAAKSLYDKACSPNPAASTTDAEEPGQETSGAIDANDYTYQAKGEKLAEAESLLARIDQLCSPALQTEARSLLLKVRAKAMEFRTLQQKAYNEWAVAALREALSEYRGGKGWVDDNEARFRRILRERIGAIDTSVLHPAVYSLYSELFQRIIHELGPNDQARVTRDMIESPRKMLSEF